MTENTTPWPSSYRYAMAHPCPTCKAPTGVECKAPYKRAQVRREGGDPIGRLHATRQQRGRAHRERDLARAPLVEDRTPGQRYDSLGGAL
ncbi:hypothetical protein ACG2OD_32195 [Streptomyces sp. PDY-4]|uniref:Uncharacterized protein n=1 Tax=Streptomyces fungicidicus TaxID=68203 RepID=A0A494UYS7_9ACTN|nr:hypothetical protein [Streptomyces fungicidicus]AYL34828.1 hypothetical protein CNQ36_04950 [Streptomyces fungicidicus]